MTADGAAVNAPTARARLIDRTFVLAGLSSLVLFVAIGLLIPLLPRYIENELDGGRAAIGWAGAAYALAAIGVRGVMARWIRRFGLKHLVAAGCVVAGLAFAMHALVASLAVVLVLRGLAGIGETFHFVGASAIINERVPSDRRAEATSYFSLSIFGGLGLGPIVGDALAVRAEYTAGFLIAAALAAVALVAALQLPTVARDELTTHSPTKAVHWPSVIPGLVLAAGIIGYTAWATLLPVYVDDVGGWSAGWLFALYSGILLMIRLVGARVPQRIGLLRGATGCIVVMSVGLVVTAAGAPTWLGTGLVALGMSVLFPSMSTFAVNSAPPAERSDAISTFSAFFEIGSLVGAPLCGWAAGVWSDRTAFALCGAVSLIGLIPLWLCRRIAQKS
jgi:MFS family permease